MCACVRRLTLFLPLTALTHPPLIATLIHVLQTQARALAKQQAQAQREAEALEAQQQAAQQRAKALEVEKNVRWATK